MVNARFLEHLVVTESLVNAYMKLFTTLNAGRSFKGLQTLAETAATFNATAFDVGYMLTHMPYAYVYQGPDGRMVSVKRFKPDSD
jgi:hypothetical protein